MHNSIKIAPKLLVSHSGGSQI